MSHLVSYKSQIEPNLRRTASKGLISLLNQQQLENLAFKYFGKKDDYGNIIGYECPYSGKVYTDYKDIVLEHIVPVVSKGGTVLFNCIPTSKEVNGADQKGAKHLITWWINSKYWDKEAPLRLEKIINYMLDAYNQVFTEYTIEEVESSYLEIETDESNLDEEDNLEYSEANESKLLKQAKNNGIHSYLGFILDCINTLENKEICNIDTTDIRKKLTELQDKHIFEDIERYQLFQNIIQKLIVSRIGNDNRSYLTYSLNFDIKQLMDSIKSNNPEEIYNELNIRLQNIEQLLKENNLSTIEYFKSLKDIQDIDIIYKNISDISEEEIKAFLENIKIGLDTKIDIFINMLNNGNDRIITRGNKETLDGYPNVILSSFWKYHQIQIKQKIFVEFKDNPEYNKARETVLEYFKVSSYEELESIRELNLDTKISIFIDMLNYGNHKILFFDNKEVLEGYPSIALSGFWSKYQVKIKQKLFVEFKDNPEYDKARETVLEYFKVSSYEELESTRELDIDTKISIFIDMLNQGNSAILVSGNKELLKGYPSIKLTYFWSYHQFKIKQKLFVEFKDNPEYNKARETVLEYFKVSSYEELESIRKLDMDTKISIFIDMLNQGNSNILKQDNKEVLEGYSSINLARFWDLHQNKIKIKLFVEFKDNPEYNKARETVLEYFKVSSYEELESIRELNLDTKISIFIDMLNQGNSGILLSTNSELLEGYPSIKLSGFWNRYKDRIKEILFIELRDNPEYTKARETVLEYFKVSSYEELESTRELDIDTKISIFIDMLNQGNSAILVSGNKELLKGYPSIKLTRFWNSHKDKIRKKLFVELKDESKYDSARRLIKINEMKTSIENQIPIFINMLNNGNKNILNARTEETLEGYPDIKLTKFWVTYHEKIKIKLFVELKDNPEYDKARETVLEYFKVSSYEELESIRELDMDTKISIFIDMLNQGNSRILSSNNCEVLDGYPSTKLAYFWNCYQDIVKRKLFIEFKNNSEYNKARETVLEYFKVSSYEELESIRELDIDTKISIFIDMLNQGNSNILKTINKETLEGYSSIKLSHFWTRHREKIKPKLFIELKDNPEYNTARQTVLDYFKVSNYEELEIKQNKGKKLKEDKKIKQELVESIKYLDEVDLTEQEQRKRA